MRTEDRLDLIKTHITDVFIGKKSKRNGENDEKNEGIAFQFTFDRFYMDFFAPLCVCGFFYAVALFQYTSFIRQL